MFHKRWTGAEMKKKEHLGSTTAAWQQSREISWILLREPVIGNAAPH